MRDNAPVDLRRRIVPDASHHRDVHLLHLTLFASFAGPSVVGFEGASAGICSRDCISVICPYYEDISIRFWTCFELESLAVLGH